MGLLYGRAGRLNTKNAGFRPGQGMVCLPYQWNPNFDVTSYNSLMGGFMLAVGVKVI